MKYTPSQEKKTSRGPGQQKQEPEAGQITGDSRPMSHGMTCMRVDVQIISEPKQCDGAMRVCLGADRRGLEEQKRNKLENSPMYAHVQLAQRPRVYCRLQKSDSVSVVGLRLSWAIFGCVSSHGQTTLLTTRRTTGTGDEPFYIGFRLRIDGRGERREDDRVWGERRRKVRQKRSTGPSTRTWNMRPQSAWSASSTSRVADSRIDPNRSSALSSSVLLVLGIETAIPTTPSGVADYVFTIGGYLLNGSPTELSHFNFKCNSTKQL
ncbi:unnamed protein product [Phyllotreta striolata]|uniref:Uncharacterized protein n=1 Tax=Phyllotreta striolata TaxID=444603 RepID=A0A9N9TMX3_PHYSR|nr:unnamed protein product [Phyllotreta striolata]